LPLLPSVVGRLRNRSASHQRPCRKFSHRLQLYQAPPGPNFRLHNSLFSLSETPLRRIPRSCLSCSPRCPGRCSPCCSDRCVLSSFAGCSHGCLPGCRSSCSPCCSLRCSTRCSTGCYDHCGPGRCPRCSPLCSDRCSPDCGWSCFQSRFPSCYVRCMSGYRFSSFSDQESEAWVRTTELRVTRRRRRRALRPHASALPAGCCQQLRTRASE